MLINEQLEKLRMTKYRLSKESGVPQATINDICSGKADLEKCVSYHMGSCDGHSTDRIIAEIFGRKEADR